MLDLLLFSQGGDTRVCLSVSPCPRAILSELLPSHNWIEHSDWQCDNLAYPVFVTVSSIITLANS